MEIFTLPLGDYQTNCYLVWDEEKNCAVIDPGYSPDAILQKAEEKGLKIQAILLTHGHFDHVGAVKVLAEKAGAAVWLNEKELSLPPFLTAGSLYYTDSYEEGTCLCVGDLRFLVMETPGHTMGSVCLRCEDALFTGDTLFAGSCGRTDLGGSWAELSKSLHRLKEMDENLRVYPGHGEDSTIENERRYNPYMGRSFE